MRRRNATSGIRISLVVALVLAAFGSFLPDVAQAAGQLNSTMVRINDMHATHTSTGSVCVEPKTSASDDHVLVTFPSQFTLSTTLGNWTTSITAPSSPGSGSNYWPSGAVGWPVALTASNVNTGTNTVTFDFASANTLSTSQVYCFDWTNAAAITSVGAAGVDLQGSVTTETAVPAVVDIGYFALTVIGDDTIVVSAVVPPIFEFSMAFNTDTFTSALSPASVTPTSGVTPKIKTNAKGGWIMWAKDSNQALTSAASGGSIPSVGWNSDLPTTMSPGTSAKYALAVTTSAAPSGTFCTESVAPEYDTVTNGGDGGEFWATYTQIGDCAGGPSNNDGLTLTEKATITVTTPASTDYTDTVTVVGAGLF